MEYLKAYTKENTPTFTKDYFGLGGVPNCSDDILVVLDCGTKYIAKVALVDDEVTWFSCCSDGWNITEGVAYWSYIPEMRVEV